MITLLLEGMTVAGLFLFVFSLVRSVALTNGPLLALLAALCIAAVFLIRILRWAHYL
jgi:hypothetical protein